MERPATLNKNLIEVITKIYDKLSLNLSHYMNELEGTNYEAC